MSLDAFRILANNDQGKKILVNVFETRSGEPVLAFPGIRVYDDIGDDFTNSVRSRLEIKNHKVTIHHSLDSAENINVLHHSVSLVTGGSSKRISALYSKSFKQTYNYAPVFFQICNDLRSPEHASGAPRSTDQSVCISHPKFTIFFGIFAANKGMSPPIKANGKRYNLRTFPMSHYSIHFLWSYIPIPPSILRFHATPKTVSFDKEGNPLIGVVSSLSEASAGGVSADKLLEVYYSMLIQSRAKIFEFREAQVGLSNENFEYFRMINRNEFIYGQPDFDKLCLDCRRRGGPIPV